MDVLSDADLFAFRGPAVFNYTANAPVEGDGAYRRRLFQRAARDLEGAMQDVVYRHPSGLTIRVMRGDARAVRADLVLFGKNRPLRSALERLSGRRFRFEEESVPGRRADVLELPPGDPWRVALSLQYAPRGRLLDRETGRGSGHLYRLGSEIGDLLFKVVPVHRPRTLLLLPLSHRRPEVVAAAQAGAVLNYCQHRAAERGVTPMFACEPAVWAAIFAVADKFGPELRREIEAANLITSTQRAEEDRRRHPVEEIILIDREDPDPFVAFLDNRDRVVFRTRLARSAWMASRPVRVAG